jgi:hypothetical protein
VQCRLPQNEWGEREEGVRPSAQSPQIRLAVRTLVAPGTWFVSFWLQPYAGAVSVLSALVACVVGCYAVPLAEWLRLPG